MGATLVHAATYSEEAVKAAFLHRFGAYVHWPSPPTADAPFVIGVVEADEVFEQLGRLLPGLVVQGRPAEARRVRSPSDLAGVHILYIGSGGLSRAQTLLATAATHPILIVTDDERGMASGATINFVRVDRSVRFEVSLAAAEHSGLRIDSRLLAVAVRVTDR